VRQIIADRASNAVLNWRDAESVHLLHFDFPAVTQGQGSRRGQVNARGARVKSFKKDVEEVAREQITHKLEDEHLGARIIFIQKTRTGDLDNFEKAIFDGLKQVAFGDDNVFDYVEKVRIKADTADDVGFVVEILKLTEKRGMSWM